MNLEITDKRMNWHANFMTALLSILLPERNVSKNEQKRRDSGFERQASPVRYRGLSDVDALAIERRNANAAANTTLPRHHRRTVNLKKLRREARKQLART